MLKGPKGRPWDVRRRPRSSASTRISSIRLRHGTRHVGSSPRSRGARASCSPRSDSSSRTCRRVRTGSCGYRISVARPSSTSRRVSMPFAGRGCPASAFATTRCGCSCTRWPATWPPSCAASNCARPCQLVAVQPTTEADQDRGPRRHLPAGRGRGHRRNGARHPRPSRATVMRVTANHAETEQNRLDRSVSSDEKHPQRAESDTAASMGPPEAGQWRDTPSGTKNA